jgi:hypothetical protein
VVKVRISAIRSSEPEQLQQKTEGDQDRQGCWDDENDFSLHVLTNKGAAW